MKIARMLSQEESAVRALYARCFPTWKPRPPHWFFLNPTTVALDGWRVVGARSVTTDATGYVMHLKGLMIDPGARGLGVGDALFRWDVERGIEMGIQSFFSTTWAANTTMRRLFERNGFHHCTDSPGYYPENGPGDRDGLVYVLHYGALRWLMPQCQEHRERLHT